MRPCRRSHVSARAVDSSGRAPARPATSPTMTSTSPGSISSPARCAGSSIVRRSSPSRIGPTSTSLPSSSVGQLGVLGAAAQVVGADGEHDRRRRLAASASRRSMNSACSSASAPSVNISSNWSTNTTSGASPAGTRRRRAGQLRRRALARAQRDRAPRLGTGEHAGGQRRQQPGPHQRRLPAARRPDHRQQAGLGDAGHQLGHQPLATEEVGGVGGLEPGQALVGAAGERGHRRACCCAWRPASWARRCSSSRWMPSTPSATSPASASSRPRVAASRSRGCSTRRAARSRATALACSWTSSGTPSVSSATRWTSSAVQPSGS